MEAGTPPQEHERRLVAQHQRLEQLRQDTEALQQRSTELLRSTSRLSQALEDIRTRIHKQLE